MAQFKVAQFFNETKQEISKVTWPTRKETVLTTVFVVCMAVVAGLFFLCVDSVVGTAISKILGMHS